MTLDHRKAQISHVVPPPREVRGVYQDPLEVIWSHCASSLGWNMIRSSEVFASWDGGHTLTLGRGDDLDSDDHLGQMVLHEICHALIEGPDGWIAVDWGLENIDARDLDRELACLRLQASWADRVNLRKFFAATTDWCRYYEVLPSNPFALLSPTALESCNVAWSLELSLMKALDKRACDLAKLGLIRADQLGWTPLLSQALRSTALIAQAVQACSSTVDERSLWSSGVINQCDDLGAPEYMTR